MAAPPIDDERELDAYLRRKYSESGWEQTHLQRVLASDLAMKRLLKGEIEQAAILNIALLHGRGWGGLGPPFLAGALTSGAPLGKAAARPFYGRWSSHEAGIRASLLPDNPWFHREAGDIRRFLGLPEGGVRAVNLDQVTEEHWYWREQGRLDADFLGNLWEHIHASKAKGVAYRGPELPPFLPPFLRGYLDCPTVLAVSEGALPGWLWVEPTFPWGAPPGYDAMLPFHRFIGNLLYRYGLPPRLFFPIRRYLFTADAGDLSPTWAVPRPDGGLSPVLEPVKLPGAVESTLTLTIQGIDAFTSFKEIEGIWKAMVEPAQESWRLYAAQVAFRERRGRFPDLVEYEKLERDLPQRAKPPFTTARTYLPVLKLTYEGKTLNQALEELHSQNIPLDHRHAERGVKRLCELMKPWETTPSGPVAPGRASPVGKARRPRLSS